jgi:hypothetical protein
MTNISDTDIRDVLAKRDLTREQAEANLRSRGYSDHKILEELQVGVMLDQLLGNMKLIAKKDPGFFLKD